MSGQLIGLKARQQGPVERRNITAEWPIVGKLIHLLFTLQSLRLSLSALFSCWILYL